MKITRRQLDQIEGIMQDEADERLQLHNEMYANKKLSALNEYFLFESDLAAEDISTVVSQELDQESLDAGSEAFTAFDKVLYKKLSELISRMGGQKVSAAVVQNDIEDFDADELMMLQQEVATDVAAALSKYAQGVAAMASHVYLAGEEPQE